MISFEEAAKEIRCLFEDAYILKRKKKSDLTWCGPELHYSLAHVCTPFDRRLTKEYLEEESDQGRDLLDVLIGITLHVGIGMGHDQEKDASKLFIDQAIRLLNMTK